MARKAKGRSRKGRSRRRRGFGSVITVRPAMRGVRGLRGLRGLGAKMGGMLMGLVAPMLGLGVPAAVILAIRSQVDPSRGDTQAKLVRYAPALGFGAGLVTALATSMLGGMGAGITTVAGAGVTAGSFAAYDMVRARAGGRIDAALMSSGSSAAAPTASPAAGLGVIVPEMRGLPSRTGAIVFERTSDGLGRPGQEINLGAVNPTVFGTPGF